MMPNIYSKADKTVIWLGPEADASDEAMDFIDSAPSMQTDDPNINLDKLVPSRALTALFRRTWWHRVWVIQEAMLSRQAVVVFGKKTVPLDRFETLQQKAKELTETIQLAARSGTVQQLGTGGVIFVPLMPFLEISRCMSYLKRKCSETMTTREAAHGLAALVVLTTRFQSTLPRDKIYGLFGLFSEVQRVVEPRYGSEKTDADVFKDVTVFLTRWTNKIDHILLWRKRESERALGAPSWVVDSVSVSEGSGPFPLPDRDRYGADGGFWTWLRLTPVNVIRGYDIMILYSYPLVVSNKQLIGLEGVAT